MLKEIAENTIRRELEEATRKEHQRRNLLTSAALGILSAAAWQELGIALTPESATYYGDALSWDVQNDQGQFNIVTRNNHVSLTFVSNVEETFSATQGTFSVNLNYGNNNIGANQERLAVAMLNAHYWG